MTSADQYKTERVILLERLLSQKDALVRASQEIEDLLYRYRAANKSDPNGELEKEVWKRLHVVIGALSELVPYSSARKDFLILLIVQLNVVQTLGWVMESGWTRLILMFANGVQIRWDLKKGPIVTLGDVSLIGNLLKTPSIAVKT